VATTLVVSSMHTPQSTHMHCFVHCRFSPAQHVMVQPEREAMTSLFQHAQCPQSTHMYCFCPLQIHCSSVQHSLWCSLSMSGDARYFSMHTASTHAHALLLSTADSPSVHKSCSLSVYHACYFSMHTPQSTHNTYCFVHCGIPLQLSAAQSAQPEREWLRRCCSQHAHASIHALRSFVHCRFTAARAAQSWCSLEHEWLATFVTSMHTLNPVHALLFIHCRFRSSVQHSLVQPGKREWLRRSLFQHSTRLQSTHMCIVLSRFTAAQCSDSLGAAWSVSGYDASFVVRACTRLIHAHALLHRRMARSLGAAQSCAA
jgi:hypothetical protein